MYKKIRNEERYRRKERNKMNGVKDRGKTWRELGKRKKWKKK